MADNNDNGPTTAEQAKANAIAQDRLRILNKEKALEAAIRKSAEATKTAKAEALEHTKEQHKGYIDLYDKQTQLNLSRQKEFELQEANLKILKDKLEVEEELAEITPKMLLALKEQVILLEKARDKAKETAKSAEKMAKAVDLSQKAAENALEQWFGINARAKEVGQVFLDNNGKVKIFNGFLSMTVKHMAQGVDKAALLGKYMMKAYEGAKKMHASAKAWGQKLITDPLEDAKKYYEDTRLTAQEIGYDIDQMNEQIVNRSREITKGYIITEAEARKTYVSMLRGATRFTLVAEEQSESIQRTATLLTRMGVDAGTTGQIWDKLQTAMQKTPETAERITANVTTLARHLKMDTNQVAQQFLGTLDQLTVYALPQAEKEFARLAATQKATGVEANKLISAMDKWTTFEGAAESAGTLNAAFGLNISSMEMMETATQQGPVEALMLLKSKFDEAGVSVEDMNLGQRRLVAGLVGSGSVSDAMALLSSDTDKLRSAQEAAGGANASLEEVQAKLAKTTDEVATKEQTAAKSLDERRKKLQGTMDTWVKFTKSIDDWIAKHPWVSMIGGLVISTAGGIGQLILLWSSWKAKAMADAAQVAAATRAATATTGMTGGPVSAAKGAGGMGMLGKAGAGAAIIAAGYMLADAGIEARLNADPDSMWGAGPSNKGQWVGGASAQEMAMQKGYKVPQSSVPSYQTGGPITQEGFLTDTKGKPLARVHAGEQVVPNTTVGAGAGGAMPPIQVALNIALQMGDKVIATSEERILEIADGAAAQAVPNAMKTFNETISLA